MKHTLTLLIAFLLAPLATLHAADDIQWLVSYDAKALPDSTWTAIGKPNAKIENGTMRFVHSWNARRLISSFTLRSPDVH